MLFLSSPQIEKRVPQGLDLIVTICFAAPLARAIAMYSSPIVNSTLLNIGGILESASHASPILMGIILGGIITVVATAPLSSMALTAMLGLTGTPMAIGALSVMGSSFMNGVFFHRMGFGDKKTTIAVAIEPLTQADIISANPVPVCNKLYRRSTGRSNSCSLRTCKSSNRNSNSDCGTYGNVWI